MNIIAEWTARDIDEVQLANLLAPRMDVPTYGASFEWRGRWVSTAGHETKEAAHEALKRMAAASGWTPRRWWQFWRWGENRPPWRA